MRKRLMKNCRNPQLRGEVCLHNHMPWSGAVPCTGVLRCTMCGLEAATEEERRILRLLAAEHAAQVERARADLARMNRPIPPQHPSDCWYPWYHERPHLGRRDS